MNLPAVFASLFKCRTDPFIPTPPIIPEKPAPVRVVEPVKDISMRITVDRYLFDDDATLSRIKYIDNDGAFV